MATGGETLKEEDDDQIAGGGGANAETEKQDEDKEKNNVNEKGNEKAEVPMPLCDGDEKENAKEGENGEVPMPQSGGKEKEDVTESETRERSDGNENKNVEENEKDEGSSMLSEGNNGVSSVKGDENVVLSDLKEYEKKALAELRSKLEQAILANKLFRELKKDEKKKKKEKPQNENSCGEKEESNATVERKEEREKEGLNEIVERKEQQGEEEGSSSIIEQKEKQEEEESSAIVEQKEKQEEEESNAMVDQKEQQDKEESNMIVEEKEEKDRDELKSKDEENAEVAKEEEKSDEGKRVGKEAKVDENISLWGVPLLPSKGDERTNVLLLKFLRGRDFKADDAFEMLRNTLEWRRDNNIDSIAEEDFGNDYDSVAYTLGFDCQGNPVCYNVYGVFADEELYNKTFGTEASRERFLRWRLQLMEKQIQKLDFRPGGVSSLVQINDLKNTPGPSRRDLRLATKRAVEILLDNYPEFVVKNIFINVPFWYYAFNAILSPFLTQRTKSKFVFSRPARVTETLLKYIAAEQIPVNYGGLLRENDPDFSAQDAASEVTVKAGATETIELPAPEVGDTLMWDVTVVGWDVNYKEEFVPADEGSYTLIVKKEKKISWQDESVRNIFRNNEPGKIVITVENGMFKKKRVFYRYKIVDGHTSASS